MAGVNAADRAEAFTKMTMLTSGAGEKACRFATVGDTEFITVGNSAKP